jgi:hypothetical protein
MLGKIISESKVRSPPPSLYPLPSADALSHAGHAGGRQGLRNRACDRRQLRLQRTSGKHGHGDLAMRSRHGCTPMQHTRALLSVTKPTNVIITAIFASLWCGYVFRQDGGTNQHVESPTSLPLFYIERGGLGVGRLFSQSLNLEPFLLRLPTRHHVTQPSRALLCTSRRLCGRLQRQLRRR